MTRLTRMMLVLGGVMLLATTSNTAQARDWDDYYDDLEDYYEDYYDDLEDYYEDVAKAQRRLARYGHHGNIVPRPFPGHGYRTGYRLAPVGNYYNHYYSPGYYAAPRYYTAPRYYSYPTHGYRSYYTPHYRGYYYGSPGVSVNVGW